MIRHVVMWKLKGPTVEEKREQAERVRVALLTLPGKIPGLLDLEVGLGSFEGDDQADVVLISSHESWEALAVYRDHPDHLAVARVVSEVRAERRFVDFEL